MMENTYIHMSRETFHKEFPDQEKEANIHVHFI